MRVAPMGLEPTRPTGQQIFLPHYVTIAKQIYRNTQNITLNCFMPTFY